MSHVDGHQPASPLQSGPWRPDADVQTAERADHQRIRLLADDSVEEPEQRRKNATRTFEDPSPTTAKTPKPQSVLS